MRSGQGGGYGRLMLELNFRAADLRDVHRLMRLTPDSGAPDWTSGTWQQVIASAAAGDRLVLVAEREAEPIGFGVIGLAGDEAEIESLAVDPAWRRRGVAMRVCEEMMEWASGRGAAAVFLEVRASNEGAQALYRRLGFEQRGSRRGYYRDPAEDAVIMAREL